MSTVDFEKKPLASEKPDACGGPGESFDVQVKKCRRRVGLRRLMTTSCVQQP